MAVSWSFVGEGLGLGYTKELQVADPDLEVRRATVSTQLYSTTLLELVTVALMNFSMDSSTVLNGLLAKVEEVEERRS